MVVPYPAASQGTGSVLTVWIGHTLLNGAILVLLFYGYE
jgi:hypothetical protein